MRHYETLFIVTPDSSEEELQTVSAKFQGVVTDMNGQMTDYIERGKKRLAYDVRKHNKGHYVLMEYVGSADVVAEIERNMRLDDRILKYITVKLADSVDPESIKTSDAEPVKDTEEPVTPEEDQAQSSGVQESEQAET
jgi:small subunit ribosomal protein S6